MRITAAIAFLLAAVILASSCGDSAAEYFCEPDTNVFCRCRGTLEAGTKLCDAAGDSFGPCETASGECTEQAEPPGGGSSSASGGNAPPAAGELLAPCSSQTDCGSGLECAMGYCTKACASYEDCSTSGDCVAIDGLARCSPYCMQQSDCAIYGDEVGCGYTSEALPPFDVVVCATWGAGLTLPPDGYPPSGNCETDARCHLGLAGKERVCGPNGCADGCHIDADCSSAEASCSSDGQTLGSCQSGDSSGDACPGIPVTVDLAGNNYHMLTGDTSTAPMPGEATGEGLCGLSSTQSEEIIYAVTATETGSLVGLLTPSATYDSQCYVRDGSCESGSQLLCEDEIGVGKSEIFEVSLAAQQTVWLFVDGWDGSAGSYTLELDFSPPE